MPDRPRALGPRFLLLAGSLFITALFAECGLRLLAHLGRQGRFTSVLSQPVPIPADGRVKLGHMIQPSANPRIIYELRPDLDVTFLDVPVVTNSEGFRGPLRPRAKPPATRRILGLGDSFMFGWGVAEQHAYLPVLEGLLNERSAGPGFEYINTAVPGYNSVMEVETLKSKGLAYGPDIVLIHFVNNDLDLPNFIRSDVPVLALDRSFLVDRLRRVFVRPTVDDALAQQGLAPSPWIAASQRFARDPRTIPKAYRGHVGWQSWQPAMEEVARLAAEHGFQPVLISFTTNFDPGHRQVFDAAQALGFDTLHVGAVFREYLDAHGFDTYSTSTLALSPRDPHPTVLGHSIASRVLYRFLCERHFRADLSSCDVSSW